MGSRTSLHNVPTPGLRYRFGSRCYPLESLVCRDLRLSIILWRMDGEAACRDGRAAELQRSAHPWRERGQG